MYVTSLRRRESNYMSLISIIIPVYNAEEYLERCLVSILKQTYKYFEVLLVDDGSNDRSVNIISDFVKKDKRVKLVCTTHGGVSVARNTGIELAKGDFLFFVDADDYIDPFLLEKLIKCQEKYNCDLVKYKPTISNEFAAKMKEGTSEEVLLTSNEALKDYLTDNKLMIAQVWSGLYKKSLFTKTRFPLGKTFEDNYVTPVILALCDTIVFIDYPGYVYYIHEGGIMHSSFSEEKAAAYDMYKQVYYCIHESFPEFKNLLIQKWIYQMIYTYRKCFIEKQLNNRINWMKRIYQEVNRDKAFFFKANISKSCRRQLKVFLLSPLIFCKIIDFLEIKSANKEKRGYR